MNTRTAFSLTALVGLGLVAASPMTHASTTIYSYQSDNGQGTTYTGAGAAGSANFQRTYYKDSSGGFNNYKNSDEAGATFAYYANGGQHDTKDLSNNYYDASTPGALLLNNNNVTNGHTGHISLTGLAVNAAFTAYFYSVNGAYAGQGRSTVFQLTDSSYTPGGSSAISNESSFTTFANPANYITLSGTTDASGSIFATYSGAGGTFGNNNAANDEGTLAGAQFVVGTDTPAAAPEPSQFAALALTGLGVLAMVVKARKRKSMVAAV